MTLYSLPEYRFQEELRALQPRSASPDLRKRTAIRLASPRWLRLACRIAVAAVVVSAVIAGAWSIKGTKSLREPAAPNEVLSVIVPTGCECRVRFTSKVVGRPIPDTSGGRSGLVPRRLDRPPSMALRSKDHSRHSLIRVAIVSFRMIYGVILS